MVLNGTELGGGSIRIHTPEMQQAVFEVLGIGREEAREKFGFLLDALQFALGDEAWFEGRQISRLEDRIDDGVSERTIRYLEEHGGKLRPAP